MQRALFWIFGLIPAAVWCGWSALYAALAFLAIFTSPAQAILSTAIALTSAFASLSIVLSVLGRARPHTKVGLIIALLMLVPYVALGTFSEQGVAESVMVLVGFGLIVVTVILLRQYVKPSEASESPADN